MILICWDHLKIVRPELLFIYLLHTVNELYGSCVPIFGEERDSRLSRLYRFKNSTYRFINKKSILDFILRFLCLLIKKSFDNLSIVGFYLPIDLILFSFLRMISLRCWLIAILAGYMRSIQWAIFNFSLLFIVLLPEGQAIISKFCFNIEFIKLVVHGIIWLLDDWDIYKDYLIEKDF